MNKKDYEQLKDKVDRLEVQLEGMSETSGQGIMDYTYQCPLCKAWGLDIKRNNSEYGSTSYGKAHCPQCNVDIPVKTSASYEQDWKTYKDKKIKSIYSLDILTKKQ